MFAELPNVSTAGIGRAGGVSNAELNDVMGEAAALVGDISILKRQQSHGEKSPNSN